jgi:hypothetical protein
VPGPRLPWQMAGRPDGKGQSPVVPRGFEKRQEVDPAWPPVPSPLRGRSACLGAALRVHSYTTLLERPPPRSAGKEASGRVHPGLLLWAHYADSWVTPARSAQDRPNVYVSSFSAETTKASTPGQFSSGGGAWSWRIPAVPPRCWIHRGHG